MNHEIQQRFSSYNRSEHPSVLVLCRIAASQVTDPDGIPLAQWLGFIHAETCEPCSKHLEELRAEFRILAN